jgi:uncharacterized iron-regulated protein
VAGACLVAPGFVGCAAFEPARVAWQSRLNGDAVVLLGEVHDNAALHRLRLAVLRRAVEAGWRPALVMEQFDLDRQGDLDRARRSAGATPADLVAAAAPAKAGWDWPFYEPLIALALGLDLPLLAGNLSRGDAGRLVRESPAAVFGEPRAVALGLEGPIDPALQAAQQREIEAGHCGALPPTLVPGMARAQLARDAAMAAVVRENAARGVVLIAGDGHVRRDIGVPRWLGSELSDRTFAVGFLEAGNEPDPGAYDAVVFAAPAAREDPCIAFRERRR